MRVPARRAVPRVGLGLTLGTGGAEAARAEAEASRADREAQHAAELADRLRELGVEPD
ncbi:MAG: hypothetical protein ACFCGT_13615 [Sandaracinaceae bacterium]